MIFFFWRKKSMIIIKEDYSNQLELHIKGLGYILHLDGYGRGN